jgi:hypothetical protein
VGSARSTRRARTKAGKCAVCLRRKASADRPTCRACRVRIAERSAELYEARRALGICTRSICNEPAEGYLCEVHAEERRDQRAVRQARNA